LLPSGYDNKRVRFRVRVRVKVSVRVKVRVGVGPIDMRVWKERRFENILKLIAIINERNNFRIYSMEDSDQYFK
jgi:hypothetical protein